MKKYNSTAFIFLFLTSISFGTEIEIQFLDRKFKDINYDFYHRFRSVLVGISDYNFKKTFYYGYGGNIGYYPKFDSHSNIYGVTGDFCIGFFKGFRNTKAYSGLGAEVEQFYFEESGSNRKSLFLSPKIEIGGIIENKLKMFVDFPFGNYAIGIGYVF